MMRIKQILLTAGFMVVFASVFIVVSNFSQPKQVDASVARFAEYTATTTQRLPAGTTNNLTNLQVIQSGAGTLGSVVITGAAGGTINFYDATSSVNNTAWATTTLASFPASTVAGTYTFDVLFQKGLMIEIIGTAATSTITYRAN